ncbi:uncharacterized protein LOC119214377 [Pungitius pungitius]|uniref:uncharacterized protein LOC119214377 n=1 Tax=Pungitius pungitius TaxID=134920 RepID=UPI002E1618C2
MDSVDICAATSEGDNRRRANERNRDWHKRLNLRRTAIRPRAVQSADKSGPKKIAGEWELGAAGPLSKKPRDTPGFAPPLGGDEAEYAPKDLVRHSGENHRGSPPVFSCRSCAFSTHELSRLQVHLLSHKDTFSSCGVCHDDVQRTWPELSAHLTALHCQDGRFPCQMCPKFSTGDVGVFLEHTYAHHSGPEGDKGPLPHAEGGDEFGPKMAARGLRCQHCGYEASRKWLIAKHVKAVHVCQNGNQRKKNKRDEDEDEEVRSLAMKPNVPVPNVKPRLTRSAVREMCWLTQDCLSLPGREFLDKYCPLSDPQTTLQETQQFLMQSVAGETGDRKWTKALKSVLSSVPDDMNVHPKSQKGVPSDLAVLTVKNKITVAQNGATYAKRLKVMTSSERETSRRVVDRNGRQSNPRTTNPNKSEPPHRVPTRKNGVSRELKLLQEMKNEEPAHEDGMDMSTEPKSTNESEEHTSSHKVAPKNKRRRRRRRASAKRRGKRPSGVALKIVLKKNPVKEKQWVSLSPSGDLPGASCPLVALEETAQVLKNTPLGGARQKERPNASSAGLGVASSPAGRAAMPPGSNNKDDVALRGSPSPHRQAKVAESLSAREAGRSELPAAAGREAETGPEDAVLQTSGGGTECQGFHDEGAAPFSDSTESSAASISVVTTQGKVNSEDVFPVLPAEQEGTGDTGLPAEPRPHLHSDVHGGTSPPSGCQRSPLAKHVERTLKLVAISPSQPVKRPAGDQPVVVLNHPDADTPEVARIMEVIHRYKGEVQKVVLSRRTADALSAEASDPEASSGCASLQERFLLRLKFRRLSRKKYEVVGAGSPGAAAGARVFRCWFCGRIFTCREAWTAHRQRHLTDWEKAKL